MGFSLVRLLSYLLAFVAAIAATLLAESLVLVAQSEPDIKLLVVRRFLPPLAGIAAFSVVFAIATGHALKARFWILALLIVYGTILASMALIYSGLLVPLEVFAVATSVVFLIGLFTLGRSA